MHGKRGQSTQGNKQKRKVGPEDEEGRKLCTDYQDSRARGQATKLSNKGRERGPRGRPSQGKGAKQDEAGRTRQVGRMHAGQDGLGARRGGATPWLGHKGNKQEPQTGHVREEPCRREGREGDARTAGGEAGDGKPVGCPGGGKIKVKGPRRLGAGLLE